MMRAITMLTLLSVCLVGLVLALGPGCPKQAPEPEEMALEAPPAMGEAADEPEPVSEAEETPEEEATEEETPETKEAAMEAGDWITTDSGLKYQDVKVGEGASPEPGAMVVVHYTGTLKDGTVFDSSRERRKPFSFPIGRGEVIEGWDEGVMTMKVGGKRTLIIPPELGYGEVGIPGGPIPPNAELHFDVELLEIK